MKHIYVPTQVFASGQSSVMADVWIAGMVLAVGVIVWMAFTGRLFRRHHRKNTEP